MELLCVVMVRQALRRAPFISRVRAARRALSDFAAGKAASKAESSVAGCQTRPRPAHSTAFDRAPACAQPALVSRPSPRPLSCAHLPPGLNTYRLQVRPGRIGRPGHHAPPRPCPARSPRLRWARPGHPACSSVTRPARTGPITR